jgi:hypothetical protein
VVSAIEVLVQFDKLPLVGVPNTGVTITIEVLVHALMLPLATVPSTGAVMVGEVRVGVASTMPVLVQALITPLATVPNAGVTNVGLVNRLVTDSCLVVLVVAWTIGNTSPPACEVATGRAEIAILAMLVISCVNVKPLASRHDAIRQAHYVVGVVDALDVALAGHCNPLH